MNTPLPLPQVREISIREFIEAVLKIQLEGKSRRQGESVLYPVVYFPKAKLKPEAYPGARPRAC